MKREDGEEREETEDVVLHRDERIRTNGVTGWQPRAKDIERARRNEVNTASLVAPSFGDGAPRISTPISCAAAPRR